MTLQRRRLGAWVEIYGLVPTVDRRGNVVRKVDTSQPIARIKGWLIADADRFQTISEGGQQEIVMFELGVADHPAFHNRDIAAEAMVKWDGYWWDVVHPPKQARGANRHVRHWRLSIRRRPIGDEGLESNG